MTPPEPDLAAQLRRFARFARDYNEERPHEALGQRTPASAYAPSARPMPERIAGPDYPPEAAARRVRSNGEIRWRSDLIAVSTALAASIRKRKDCAVSLSPPARTARRRPKPNHERLSPMYPVYFVTHLSAGQ
jgi:Integrase core domain